MSKNEFLDQLSILLSDVSPEEKEEVLAYYREYIEDAGLENEEAILEDETGDQIERHLTRNFVKEDERFISGNQILNKDKDKDKEESKEKDKEEIKDKDKETKYELLDERLLTVPSFAVAKSFTTTVSLFV